MNSLTHNRKIKNFKNKTNSNEKYTLKKLKRNPENQK